MSLDRILIALDEGPLAAYAAEVGLDLARSQGSKVALVLVVDSSVGALPERSLASGASTAMAVQRGSKVLATIRQRARLKTEPLAFIPLGHPPEEIVKTAKEWRADLIVIGSHCRSGVEHVLLGSVADRVLRDTPCPVLVVRAKG